MVDQLRIGTRRSPMALAQTQRVVRLLNMSYPSLDVLVVPMVAAGDRHQGDLAEIGGKRAWVRELDAALLTGHVDITVSCAKDCHCSHDRPAGTAVGAVLAREDPRDALVVANAAKFSLAELPDGHRIGTSAFRRIAQLRRQHPTLNVVPIRGNVNSRLSKLDMGETDSLVLAVSGLYRIGQQQRITQILPVEIMCPAAGAGIVVVEYRAGQERFADLLSPLSDLLTAQALTAERAVLAELRGHCRSPIAAHATHADNGQLVLHAAVWHRNGQLVLHAAGQGSPRAAQLVGTQVAAELIAQGAHELIASCD